jgi:hypothetical protein
MYKEAQTCEAKSNQTYAKSLESITQLSKREWRVEQQQLI